MEEWKEYRLGEVLTIKYGKDHKKLLDGDIPVYGSGGIMRYVNNHIYEGPSIMIPRKGSLNNIMYSDKPFWTVDTMFWSIIKTDIVNPLFLYYTIYKKDFASLNVGTAVPSLTVPVIEDILVTIPPLPTQQKIANILSSLDDKIEVNRRINENLEAQAQALFKSWFVDFEPFKDGEFVESELGMIPKGWRVKRLEEVSKLIAGGDKPDVVSLNKTDDTRGADIPEIKNGNQGKMPTRYIITKNFKSKALNNNDIVIEISGGSPTQSTGRVCRISNKLLD